PVIWRAFAIRTRKCRTPRISESQAWRRRYRNDESEHRHPVCVPNGHVARFARQLGTSPLGAQATGPCSIDLMDATPAAPEIKEAERQIARIPLVLNRRNFSWLTERICAAIFPCVHVGRVWMAWYLAPVPNNWAIWPNFRSALVWDVFAVSTYFTVSVLFWYTGLIPDLATLRDRATTKIRKFLFGIFACGWRGSNRNWRHYEMAYLLLAGLSTPLVLSVHSVVSFD